MRPTIAVAFALALAVPTASVAGQAKATGLEMLGLAPGLTQSDLQGRVAKLGSKLSCRASTVDKRFSECTAVVVREGHTWELLASVVDGTSAVLLLKTAISAKDLEAMKDGLAEKLGRPNYRKRGNQLSYEWVRSGRMMRLTSRSEKGAAIQLSVSLVEGSVLDALNASR